MRNTEVHKIGGSVLKDPKETNRIIHSLSNTAPKKLVIVSAIYGVTDIIDQAAFAKSSGSFRRYNAKNVFSIPKTGNHRHTTITKY